LLTEGDDSKDIALKLKKPLSTVQRRIRTILEKRLVDAAPRLNYCALGIKKGLLHVYLQDGNYREAAERLAAIDGVISSSIHLGNSDIVLEFGFGDSNDVIALISQVKRLEGVEKIVWSEEVYSIKSQVQLQRKNGKKNDNGNGNNGNGNGNGNGNNGKLSKVNAEPLRQ
jgi:hypothetical protein